MSVIKQFSIIPLVKRLTKRTIQKELPSNILYSIGAALYEQSNRMKKTHEKEFFRKSTERILQTVKNLRALEAQYYVGK